MNKKVEIKAKEVKPVRRWQETRGKQDERASTHESGEYEKTAEKPEETLRRA